MMSCKHEPIDKKEGESEFMQIANSMGEVLYIVKLCKKCHALYWEHDYCNCPCYVPGMKGLSPLNCMFCGKPRELENDRNA